MIQNLSQQLKKLAKFLNLNLDLNRLNCLVKHPEGQFHRKPRSDVKPEFPFDAETVSQIVSHIKNIDLKLKTMNFNGIPFQFYCQDLLSKFEFQTNVKDVLVEEMCSNS